MLNIFSISLIKEAVMKNISLLFIAFFLIQFTTLAQAPTVEWSKVYDFSYHINANSVHQTEEGNYIIEKLNLKRLLS